MNYTAYNTLIEDCGVHPLLGPEGRGYGIEQNPHELATFLTATEPLGIQTVLEIGTGYRAGLARFMSEALGWRVTSVDIVDYHHIYPGIEFVVNPDPRRFLSRVYDLVIVDGDHRYEAVKRDYRDYGSRAREGVVMFHDIAGLRDCEGAARFWQEISRNKRGHLRTGFNEVIADDEFRAGIGWVTTR